jgi:D-alanyl-lipoteichoic acid acyltransferase DltB (MBOAT superfamily)
MLFNSYEYIFIFLPAAFLIYFYLNHKRITEAGLAFLIFSSLFFYSWWNIVYLPLILGSILFNYVIGNQLSKSYEKRKKGSYKKCFLTLGITANISLLGYFKYSDFFISNINYAFDADLSLLNLSIPLAISFSHSNR